MATPTPLQSSIPSAAGGATHAPTPPETRMDTRDDFAQEKLNPGTKRPRDDDNSDAQPSQPPKRPSTAGEPSETTNSSKEQDSLADRGIVAPPFERNYRIDGINRKEYLYLAGPTTKGIWDNLEGHKVLAHIPNDWYRLDPTTTIRTVSRVAKLVTGNDNLSVLPATPQFPKLAEATATYIPTLIVDITAEDEKALLAAPLFSTDQGTIVTKSYTFSPSWFICQLGNTCLVAENPRHVAALTQAIRDLIRKAGSGPNRIIASNYDNIPEPDKITNTEDRATYIAGTVRVEPIVMGIRHDDGSQDTRTRFNIYALPPTNNYAKHQAWVDNFTRQEAFNTMYGPARPVETYLCTHCSAQSHPSGLCPYFLNLTSVGFQDTNFPDKRTSVPVETTKRGGPSKNRDNGKRHGKSGGRGNGSKGKNVQHFK